ncbi:MAG: Holliday junction branch migration protein RuvA [Candidatus Cloacimonadaceae bacterium]|nr:Holliday junction branch migration protein RuvA [Candidatus Cloacimonadaceae bacterium]MDP3113927.1 Holliday junction branch migration protein RuvA [Candidatus Cloacimonadaceae bacterium]
MIYHIKGILHQKSPVKAVIETAMGLAFELKIPISTYEKLPEIGQPCELITHLHIGQDDIRLFGFSTTQECELFLMLTRISGIGPKIALSIISTLAIPTFVRAIERGEEALITKVPGIGKKSAQRLIIELKGSVRHLAERFEHKDRIVEDDKFMEVESALVSLGFNVLDINRELNLLPAEVLQLPPELLLKETIKRLYQRSK